MYTYDFAIYSNDDNIVNIPGLSLEVGQDVHLFVLTGKSEEELMGVASVLLENKLTISLPKEVVSANDFPTKYNVVSDGQIILTGRIFEATPDIDFSLLFPSPTTEDEGKILGAHLEGYVLLDELDGGVA